MTLGAFFLISNLKTVTSSLPLLKLLCGRGKWAFGSSIVTQESGFIKTWSYIRITGVMWFFFSFFFTTSHLFINEKIHIHQLQSTKRKLTRAYLTCHREFSADMEGILDCNLTFNEIYWMHSLITTYYLYDSKF